MAEAKEEEEGDRRQGLPRTAGEEQEMGPGGCVSRGGTRLSYTLKMFPVAAERGSAIRARVRGQGSKNLGGLDRSWLVGYRDVGELSKQDEGSTQNLNLESSPQVM